MMQCRVIDWIRRHIVKRHQLIQPVNSAKMREQRLCSRIAAQSAFPQPQRSMQQTTWTGCVDQEPGGELEARAASPRLQCDAIRIWFHPFDAGFIQILHAFPLRLADEKSIKVLAKPVRVGDLVVWTRRDHQLTVAFLVHGEALAELVMAEGKAALEPTGDLRMRSLPGAPLDEGQQSRQIVAAREVFEQQIGERRRGFADGKPRMAVALEQQHRESESPGDQGQQRTGKTRAGYCDVKVTVHVLAADLIARAVGRATFLSPRPEIGRQECRVSA